MILSARSFVVVVGVISIVKILSTSVLLFKASNISKTSLYSEKVGLDVAKRKDAVSHRTLSRHNWKPHNHGVIRKVSPQKFVISGSVRKASINPNIRKNPVNQYFVRSVPVEVSRFNFPWRIPSKVNLPTLEESNNRILYSPLREVYGAGLGHAMATINADVSTALRFNLTYTHRIARYDTLSQPYSSSRNISEMNRPFHSSGAVEQLFGWGAGEIPREHVQRLICPTRIISLKSTGCVICNEQQLKERKHETDPHDDDDRENRLSISVDQLVEIPGNLSYFYPSYTKLSQMKYAQQFTSSNNKPNTVFMMPGSYCNQSPAYSITNVKQRAYFFHKYWDAHGNHRQIASSNFENESFEGFKNRILKKNRIPHLGRRPRLMRLDEKKINIAVHARRGDFFFVNRPMISMTTISSVIREVMSTIITNQDWFSNLPVSIHIFSEGPHKHSKTNLRGDHDVSKMAHEFMDIDGSVLSEQDVENILRNNIDNLGDVFKNGLEINLRIAEDTILSIHEMIAADIFIGSESGLSTHIVGSISRAAFLLLPSHNAEDKGRIFHFDGASGKIRRNEIKSLTRLWKRFVSSHKEQLQKTFFQ